MHPFLTAASLIRQTHGSDLWKGRVDGIINGLDIFFPSDNIMSEISCEPIGSCNTDQQSFKTYLSSWMAATIQLAPYTHDQLMPKLHASAQAAAKQCNGPQNACGLRWNMRANFDGLTGVGE